MAWFRSTNGHAFPSTKWICARYGVSVRTVRRWVSKLRQDKLVSVVRRGRTTPEYITHIETSPRHPIPSSFYLSREWRSVRYAVLKRDGARCVVCGRKPSDGVLIHVDHILPRSTHPESELDPSNLQVMCDDCNIGKSNKDSIRWSGKC